MNPAPQVSVIIPVYNRESLISRAVESVLAQQDCVFECIVVNDGSSDGTRAVLDGYGAKIIAIHQDNAGRSAARNAGIERAQGEYLAFLDSDDTWKPRKLATQVAWHKAHPECGLSAHGIDIVYEDNRVESQPPRCDREQLAQHAYEAVMDHFAFFPSVVMAKRDVVLEIGSFATDYHGAEDLDFALKIAMKRPLGVFDECLTSMYQHGGQTGKKQLARENVRVLTRHLELFADRFDKALTGRLRRKVARYKISIAKRSESREESRLLLGEALALDPALKFKPSFMKLRLKGWFSKG
ncbi:MAG: glycosyltransferase family A protein [Planctomycetota bacterium]|nr:glycosyltransferase family A protein [Planctomycetota bacterium]